MVSALNTSRRTSGSCPRFILTGDCVQPPVPTSWFLPHAGLHSATALFRSQELEHETRYRPVSPPRHISHSGDSWRHFFYSDNDVNNTSYCVAESACTQHHVNPGVTEQNWTATWPPWVYLYWSSSSSLLSWRHYRAPSQLQRWFPSSLILAGTKRLFMSPSLVLVLARKFLLLIGFLLLLLLFLTVPVLTYYYLIP